MSEPFLGQIYLVGYNFNQRGFACCAGQLLPIASNTALFSLFGTMYGGDGRTTFGLPDLQGRVAVGQGRGPGLSNYQQGQKGGAEDTTLTVAEMPSHNHAPTMHAETSPPSTPNPAGGMLGISNIYAAVDGNQDVAMATNAIRYNNMGGGQSFDIRQPYLALNYEVALVGIFPSRT